MIYSDGLEPLIVDLAGLAELPEDVIYEMLESAGAVVVEAQKEQIGKLGLVDTAKMRESIKVDHKRCNAGGVRYINVYPHGEHHKYRARVRTKTYKRSKSGRTYTYGGGMKSSSNSEVAFIHEFGAPGRNIKASQWMRQANESCIDEATAAETAVYDMYLQSRNL